MFPRLELGGGWHIDCLPIRSRHKQITFLNREHMFLPVPKLHKNAPLKSPFIQNCKSACFASSLGMGNSLTSVSEVHFTYQSGGSHMQPPKPITILCIQMFLKPSSTFENEKKRKSPPLIVLFALSFSQGLTLSCCSGTSTWTNTSEVGPRTGSIHPFALP